MKEEKGLYTKNEILNAIENCLDDYEKVIFKSRHDVDSDPMTLEQLCSKFNISRDVLISIENKILHHLRETENPE